MKVNMEISQPGGKARPSGRPVPCPVGSGLTRTHKRFPHATLLEEEASFFSVYFPGPASLHRGLGNS